MDTAHNAEKGHSVDSMPQAHPTPRAKQGQAHATRVLCVPHTKRRSVRSSCTCGAPSKDADGRSYVFDNGFVDAVDADSDADSGCAETPAAHKSSGTTERREHRPRTSLCGLLADYSVPM